MDFRLKDGEQIRTVIANIGSSTVIEPGDLVDISSGLITKATASSTKLAWCPNGSKDGETEVEVTVGNDFTLLGKGDTNFAITHKGIECDLVVNSNEQQIDLGASSTKVLKVGISKDAGTSGDTDNIEVRINAPLF